jgi:hypothetical protein
MKKIKVISATNCNNCELLYNVVSTIVKSKNIPAEVEKVVDGKIKHAGAPIPAPQVVEKLITED